MITTVVHSHSNANQPITFLPNPSPSSFKTIVKSCLVALGIISISSIPTATASYSCSNDKLCIKPTIFSNCDGKVNLRVFLHSDAIKKTALEVLKEKNINSCEGLLNNATLCEEIASEFNKRKSLIHDNERLLVAIDQKRLEVFRENLKENNLEAREQEERTFLISLVITTAMGLLFIIASLAKCTLNSHRDRTTKVHSTNRADLKTAAAGIMGVHNKLEALSVK